MVGTLGSHLRSARTVRRWSLKELGERLVSTRGEGGVSPQYLNDLEHDRRTPSEQMLVQLAEALDLDLDALRSLARRSSPDVEAYLAKHAGSAADVARVFRRAAEAGFTGWDQVERLIPRPGKRRRVK